MSGFNWGATWTWIVASLLPFSLAGCPAMTGCAPNDWRPTAMPAELTRATDAGVANTFAQAVMDQYQLRVRGHGQDPGLETYVGNETTIGMRIRDVDSDFWLDAGGHGNQVWTEEDKARLWEIFQSATTNAQREFILKLLGVAPATTPPAPTTQPSE